MLFQSGQLLSAAGTASTTIAYPLLVLALTHSPAKAGIVSFARVIPYPLLSVLGGVLADRVNRKRLMIAMDVVRVAAIGTLVGAILVHEVGFWLIPLVAFVEGAASSVFASAKAGALRAVVPPRQLPAAAATESGRQAAVRLAGPPLGGALYGVGRALPFVVDVASYAFSTLALLGMRTPFQEEREPETASLRAQIREGFAYLWAQPFLRTTALLFGIADFVFPGLTLALVVIGKRQGLSGGEIGALSAVFGAALLLGSFLSPLSRRAFSMRTILLVELWAWTGCALFLVWPSVYALAIGVVPQALAIPSTDSVVHGYRMAITPDRLISRVDGAARNVSLVITPLGPLLVGLLLSSTSERATIAVLAGCTVVLALWGTLSPSIRRAPSLADLDELERPQPLTV